MHPYLKSIGMAGAVVLAIAARGQDSIEARLQTLAEQNRRLQEQVQSQQQLLEALSAQLKEVRQGEAKWVRQLQELKAGAGGPAESVGSARRANDVRVSGEAGFGLFRTGAAGSFPKSEFRADDPVISVEVPVRKGIYFFTELRLLPRETNSESFQLGEMYVDFEDISAAWGRPGQLALRAGRLNIPFGEEYQVRGPIANPLISHSLGDVWGVDEGIEAYGCVGPFNYVVAVQNGGVSRLRDFNADKSVTARIGGNATRWLKLSASAMRTGELATVADNLSEVWFANGFFRALGPARSTGTFWASLFEVDATVTWASGHLGAALGAVRFDDSDTTADNSRRMRYGHVELVQTLGGPIFGAARYSAIRVPGGYPLTGWGAPGTFFFRPSLTEELRRMSVGVGYRLGDSLVLKAEYTRESGRMTNGAPRDQENFLGGEVAVKF